MTNDTRAELRRLETEARGPRWLVPHDESPCFGGHETDDHDAWTWSAPSWADAELIVAMRNAIVPLLDAIDAAEAERDAHAEANNEARHEVQRRAAFMDRYGFRRCDIT